MRDFLVGRDGTIADVIDHTPRAASFFIDPTGEVISEVLQDEEGTAYAEIDLSRCVEPKQFHDERVSLSARKRQWAARCFINSLSITPTPGRNKCGNKRSSIQASKKIIFLRGASFRMAA